MDISSSVCCQVEWLQNQGEVTGVILLLSVIHSCCNSEKMVTVGP